MLHAGLACHTPFTAPFPTLANRLEPSQCCGGRKLSVRRALCLIWDNCTLCARDEPAASLLRVASSPFCAGRLHSVLTNVDRSKKLVSDVPGARDTPTRF